MSNTTALILSGTGYELSIAPEAETQKAELLQRASAITAVTDPASSESARNEIKRLAAMRNLVEKSRKDVKEPVLKIGKDIDTKAKDFVGDLEAEEKRLTTLVGTYAAEVERERQRQIREAEEKRRAEEAARIKAEQEAAEAARKAEAAKIAANKAFLEEEDEDTSKADEAARIAAEAAAAAAKAAAEAEAAKAQPIMPVFVPQKADGVKFVPDFEVEDIHALYAYSAALVSMEPKRSDILALIKQLTTGETLPTIPGLRVFQKAAVSTR